MKIRLSLVTMSLLSCVSVFAQNSFEVSGTVVDKMTGEAVIGGSVKLMALPDSSFVEGTTTGTQGEFSLKNVKKGTYALKITYIGYATKCIDVDLSTQKKKALDIGYITMAADAIQLQGVEVTAHAAKVAVSGDSLVYNTAAYRVPEGSTLEALVKQLPGAKVDKEGNITINGKTVSKILVDGKEFFLNDKEVAMKNIPTEMIDKLKTYDRKSDLSRVTGIDDGEEETVLDLTVKKGMKNGWYGNVNLGAGTQHRYAERFNVNHFKDDFQATLLGSANNVSDMGFGGGGGRWGWSNQGLRSSKEIGGNFATAKLKLETGGSIRYRFDGSDNENTSSTEYFNATLAKFNEDYTKNMTSNQRLTGNFRIEWKPDTMTNIIFRPDITYSRNRGRGNSMSASYSANPTDTITNRLADFMVNSNANSNMSYSTNTSLKGELQANRKLNSRGRNVTLRVVGNYGDGRSKQLSAADITYNNMGTEQQNKRYYETPTKSYKAEQQRGIYSWLWFNTTRNSIDNKTTYDNTTGVRTTMPMNINGNWNGGGGVGFNTGLGKQKLFNIGIDLGGDYTRRVGFYNNDFEGNADTKSVTRSINLNSGLEFSYRKDQISIMFNGMLDYANSKNDLNQMGNMNTYDFSYGAEFEWTSPWGTSLSTDIGMSSRRGYSSSEMNTNELLWNAQVSHSFLRGRALTVMFEVNDILGQQTNISRNIDALMRTDSRHNAIYQYGMLRVVYRFNILGGKNNLKAEKKSHDDWGGDWGDWGGGW